MPLARRIRNTPAAIAAPVDPPETSASARPSATARAACTIEASGAERTAIAGSAALAIETGAFTTVTPSGTVPIRSAGPHSSTRVPPAVARAAPSATSAAPRSAPFASTATVTGSDSGTPLFVIVVVRRPGDHLAPGIGAAHRADPVGQARAVALGAAVVGRRRDLVLSAALSGPRSRLLLLGDGHGRRLAALFQPQLAQLGPPRVGLAFMPVVTAGQVEVLAAHRAQAGAVLAAHQLRGEGQRQRVADPPAEVQLGLTDVRAVQLLAPARLVDLAGVHRDDGIGRRQAAHARSGHARLEPQAQRIPAGGHQRHVEADRQRRRLDRVALSAEEKRIVAGVEVQSPALAPGQTEPAQVEAVGALGHRFEGSE